MRGICGTPKVVVAILMAACVSVRDASADVIVERICGGTTLTVSTWLSGDAITVNPTTISPSCSGGAVFRVRSTSPATESIGRITFVGSPGSTTYVNALLIGPSNATGVSETTDFAANAAVNWAGLNPGAYSMDVQVRISGNLTDTVTASSIFRILVGGSIEAAADITETGSAHAIAAVTATGEIAGDVLAQGNNIALVESLTGNISGTVQASAGTVEDVFALNGTISGVITSNRGMISEIKAKNITANITANGQLQPLTEYYAINTIQATEDIGTQSQPITITTEAGAATDPTPAAPGFNNASIKRIFGRNIFANVTTPVPTSAPPYTATNKRGNIRELKTTGARSEGHGRFVGTISTFSSATHRNRQWRLT